MLKTDVVSRGFDSSGRPLLATRMMWQHFDRVNDLVDNKMVPIQAGFQSNGAAASAGTHDLAGCLDIRTWNLTTTERDIVMRAGRDPQKVGGAAWWYRTVQQGFAPHIHMVLLGDSPVHYTVLHQIAAYKNGQNGLASNGKDDFWRPAVIENYKYVEEDDMFEAEDRKMLKAIQKELTQFRTGEYKRDQQEKKKFSQMITSIGQQADNLTLLINQTKDDATKQQLKAMQKKILAALAEDPDVDGIDKPADVQ